MQDKRVNVSTEQIRAMFIGNWISRLAGNAVVYFGRYLSKILGWYATHFTPFLLLIGAFRALTSVAPQVRIPRSSTANFRMNQLSNVSPVMVAELSSVVDVWIRPALDDPIHQASIQCDDHGIRSYSTYVSSHS
jgi:hypothetical protein